MGPDTVTALITIGLRSALAGDDAAAGRALARLHARPEEELAFHGASVPVLEALAAFRAKRWGDAVRILQPVARDFDEPGLSTTDAIGRPWPRWLMAESWEKLGKT